MGTNTGFVSLALLASAVAGGAPTQAHATDPLAGTTPADPRHDSYIEQLEAPGDSPGDAALWIGLDSLVPAQVLEPVRFDKLVVVEPIDNAIRAPIAVVNAGHGQAWNFDLVDCELDPGGSGALTRSAESDESGFAAAASRPAAGLDQAGRYQAICIARGGVAHRPAQMQRVSGNNISIILQWGGGNRADVEQEGSGNVSVITQRGSDNVATVRQ
jgi:hypothetical protein